MHALTHLLRAARDDRARLTLDEFSEHQIQWAVESGIGPLLRRYLADTPSARASPMWPLLQGADLSAQMIAAEHLDAMETILRACGSRIQPPTLLKGISVGSQFYPEPHLRPMRDIDFLVAEDEVPVVECALLELGYSRQSTYSRKFYEAHHHTTPFRHPETGVWVEVHRGLRPSWSPVASDAVFRPDRVSAERTASEFRGHRVYRLSAELQLVYLASHWAYDFRRVSGLVAMFDALYLLGATRSVRWERILAWLDGAVAAIPVYLLLTYLSRHRVVELPAGLLGEMARRQHALGPVTLGLLRTLIDRYIVNGREFGLLMSERNFQILWQTLVLPQAPLRKLPRVLWNLLPSRAWLVRMVSRAKTGSVSDTP